MDALIQTVQRAFIPALPTLSPWMLLARQGTQDFPPFSSSRAHYFYFARNAVWLLVRILGLEGKEVLVPSYHHGVEVEALVDAGAVPCFYRVGQRWEVDVADVERRISSRTRAIYLIHYAGFPGPWAELRRLADRYGLLLVEDCALSLLSSDGGVPLGSVGDVAVFCLYKTLPLPNGGACMFNGEHEFAIPRQPSPPRASTFSHVMSSLLAHAELRGGPLGRQLRGAVRGLGHAAVSAAQIERVATGTMHFERRNVDLGISPWARRLAGKMDLRSIVEARRRNYFHIMAALRELAPPLKSELPPGVAPLFYPVIVEDKAPVMAALAERGIESIDFWRFFHPACSAAEFPETAWAREHVLEIPCHQDLDAEQISWMAEMVGAVLGRSRTRFRMRGGR